MPRKTKEQTELEKENKEEKVAKKAKTTTTKKTTAKKVASEKAKPTATATKKEPIKKASKKVSEEDDEKSISTATQKSTATKSSTKSATAKKSSSTKVATKSVAKTTAKKSTATKTDTKKVATSKKKTTKKSTSTKKNSTTKKTTKKSVANKKKLTLKVKLLPKTLLKKSATKKKKVEIVEYYDLPYRYNQTVVKVLAQTPTNLFIYWDISDTDRKNFEKQYGENFFETTKPILIVHNDTLGYSFEVEINDFANSWYLHVNDSKCDYRIELGRRPIIKNEKLNTDYIYVSMSNKIESPNDHILFNKNQKIVYFRNVKTGVQIEKDITSISFIRNMGKLYNIYDIYELYKALYGNEKIEDIYDLSNPSSGNPSSRKSFIFQI